MDPEPLDLALGVARLFESLGVRYVIVGSVASAIHGEVRTTLHVDIVAELQDSHVREFLNEAEKEFLVQESAVRRAIRERASFNMIHREALLKVVAGHPGHSQDPGRAAGPGVSEDERRRDGIDGSALQSARGEWPLIELSPSGQRCIRNRAGPCSRCT